MYFESNVLEHHRIERSCNDCMRSKRSRSSPTKYRAARSFCIRDARKWGENKKRKEGAGRGERRERSLLSSPLPPSLTLLLLPHFPPFLLSPHFPRFLLAALYFVLLVRERERFCCCPIFRAFFWRPYISFGSYWNGNAFALAPFSTLFFVVPFSARPSGGPIFRSARTGTGTLATQANAMTTATTMTSPRKT